MRAPRRFALSIKRSTTSCIAFLRSARQPSLGFAPFELFPLPVLTLAALFALWQRAAAGARGGRSAVRLRARALLCRRVVGLREPARFRRACPRRSPPSPRCFSACFSRSCPRLAGYGSARACRRPMPVKLARRRCRRCGRSPSGRAAGSSPGFPWLAVGYSQVPASPLAGYAPVLGVYGVSLATAVTAGLLAALLAGERRDRRRKAKDARSRRSSRSSFILHSFVASSSLWSPASRSSRSRGRSPRASRSR